jgi:hypothetical protein
VESTTAAHSERVSEPLRFDRNSADLTGLANRPKPVFHFIVVKNKKTRRVAGLCAALRGDNSAA